MRSSPFKLLHLAGRNVPVVTLAAENTKTKALRLEWDDLTRPGSRTWSVCSRRLFRLRHLKSSLGRMPKSKNKIDQVLFENIGR